VLAFALPVEVILLQALSTPDSTEAVQDWVSGLSSEELDAVAGEIQSYPFVYRREVMRALTPERRAAVWRGHIEAYLASHPELDASARQLLTDVIALAGPETFVSASADVRGRTAAAAEQLVTIIGRETTLDLLYRLGPRDGTFASLEPVRLRMANYVRGVMVAMADGDPDCSCALSFGCEDGAVCSDSITCVPDEEWPMCGWYWNEVCDGRCLIREVN
jgi:hypothetical protein